MECSVIKMIRLGRQEFQICADENGTLHMGVANMGRFCTASLAEACPDSNGKYPLIEHDVLDRESGDLMDSIVRGQCADRAAAIRRLAELVSH